MMMLIPFYPWLDLDFLLGRPNIGSLMGLCEENYTALRRLVPDLRRARGALSARCPGNLDLHLDVLDQAPYTTSLRLTYYFPTTDPGGGQPEPDVRLRVYHDARQAEVLTLHSKALALLDQRSAILLDKWRVNLFLAKWLGYCLDQGYVMGGSEEMALDGEQGRARAVRAQGARNRRGSISRVA